MASLSEHKTLIEAAIGAAKEDGIFFYVNIDDDGGALQSTSLFDNRTGIEEELDQNLINVEYG